jgi:hypothetical protein
MTTQSVKGNLSQAATRPKMGWSILRMVVLSIIVGIFAAGLAKLLLMGIGLTETYFHDGALFNVDGTPLMDLAKEQGIENATLRPFNVVVMVVFGLIVGCMTY